MSENIVFHREKENADFHIVKENNGMIRTYVDGLKRPDNCSIEKFRKICEKITGEALSDLSECDIDPTIKDYAVNVVLQAGKIAEALKDAGYGEFDLEIRGGESIHVTPCAYGETKGLDDIEYYLTDDPVADGTDSIYTLASRIVQYDIYEKELENEKDKLYEFYIKNIRPIEDIDYDDQTDAQRNVMEYYSDWHKDVYYHRPRNDSDECKKRYEENLQEIER